MSTTGRGCTEWRAELARELVAADVVAGEHPQDLAQRLGVAKPDVVLNGLTNIAADPPRPGLRLTVMGGRALVLCSAADGVATG